MKQDLVEKLIEFFSEFKLHKYKKGEILYRQGDYIHDVAFIKSGYVRLYTVLSSGREVTINLFKPVFIITLMYSLQDRESPYFMEAVTEVEIWKAPKTRVLDVIKEDVDVTLEILSHSFKVLDKVLENVEDTSGSAGQKVASLLLSLAKASVSKRGIAEIEFSMTKRVIASLAGITRETATLEIKKLEGKGLLRLERDKVIILSLTKLREYADL